MEDLKKKLMRLTSPYARVRVQKILNGNTDHNTQDLVWWNNQKYRLKKTEDGYEHMELV